MSETNESKMKVVGKSAEAVNRVVDILMGVDAEFQVPMQGLELYARPGVKDFQAQNHWWRDDAELDDGRASGPSRSRARFVQSKSDSRQSARRSTSALSCIRLIADIGSRSGWR